MHCAAHPGFTATGTCAACGRPVCDNCKVQMGWNIVCFQRKDRVAQGMQGGSVPGAGQFGGSKEPILSTGTSPEAKQALAFAIVGIFCFGLILGIVAVIKANDAKRRIRRYGLGGDGLATAALVIGIFDIATGALWTIPWLIASVTA